MNADDRQMEYWRDRIQDYLDDTLPRKEAVAFFMYAKEHPELQTELDAYREMTAALETVPRAEPTDGFDAAVLSHVPYEHYRTAPRLARPVLVLGDLAPAAVGRALRSLRRGATAFAAAYVLALIVSQSFLAESATSVSRWLGDSLATLAERAQGTPVLSTIVGSVVWLYDAGVSVMTSLGTVVGQGALTVALGILVGASVWVIVSTTRRRSRSTEA